MLQIGQNICSSPYCFQLDCVWTADNHEAVIQKKKKAYRENRIVTRNLNIYRGYQKRSITKFAVRQIAVCLSSFFKVGLQNTWRHHKEILQMVILIKDTPGAFCYSFYLEDNQIKTQLINAP